MSKQDVDDGTMRFTPPKKVEPRRMLVPVSGAPQEEGSVSECYDKSGRVTPDENRCAAKKITGRDGDKYYAKWCLEGPDRGHLLNPCSIYYNDGDDMKMESHRGTRRYEFRKLSKKGFDSYITFLTTKIFSHCQAAERDVLHG